MAPTSKLLKMLVKNNILQLHKAAQKPDKGYAYFFFQLSKLRKQRAKEVLPILRKSFPPVTKNWTPYKCVVNLF